MILTGESCWTPSFNWELCVEVWVGYSRLLLVFLISVCFSFLCCFVINQGKLKGRDILQLVFPWLNKLILIFFRISDKKHPIPFGIGYCLGLTELLKRVCQNFLFQNPRKFSKHSFFSVVFLCFFSGRIFFFAGTLVHYLFGQRY